MSLGIDLLQRKPLFLAAAVVMVLAGSQFATEDSVQSAPVWERPAGLQYGAVGFDTGAVQPVSLAQTEVKAATLPFVSRTTDPAVNQPNAQRWVF